ncbi:nuclear pore complex protein DDB_G0274915 [Folsomia candida]|nr:nuclear pore complex protein DDB_G0274915 [Folsomia candida]
MSSHSDNDNGDEESFISYDASFHEEALRYMKSTGFMAQVKGEISKYLFDTVKTRLTSYIIPDRADKEILSQIYDYLQWVGMKSTAGVLLSETPVEVTPTERNSDDESPPPLVDMFASLRQKDDKKSSNLDNKSPNLNDKSADFDLTFDDTLPNEHKEDKIIEQIPNETFTLQEEPETILKDVETPIPLVNRNLLLPPSGDLLTGSPLSTPVASSITKLPIRPQKSQEQEKPTSGDKFPLSISSSKKKESFEDLLLAYVGNDDTMEETPTKSDKTLQDESSLFKTPAGVGPPSKPSSDSNLIAFTTSTPINDNDNTPSRTWEQQQQVTTTPLSTPLSSSLPTTDKTFTILKSGGEPERNFFSKQQPHHEQEHDESPESSWSSASISLPKKSESSPPPPPVEPSSRPPPPPSDEEEDDVKSTDGKKSAASTSDVVSLDLEVDNDDITQDISLASDAIGMSECDHFVNIIK